MILREGFKERNEDELTKELQEHVKALTAPYKYPRSIVFIDELPKTTSGKFVVLNYELLQFIHIKY